MLTKQEFGFVSDLGVRIEEKRHLEARGAHLSVEACLLATAGLYKGVGGFPLDLGRPRT